MDTSKMHWVDRVTAPIAPLWTLKRQRARAAASLLQRHYEAAAPGRRTQSWYRVNTDANAALGPALAYLRATARDLVRNNPYAESALSTIVDHTVGWGIEAKPMPKNGRAIELWKAWAGSTACDADGRHDFPGLQKLVMRTVVESGEVLVRRRQRRLEDGFALPIQLQILEPDFLDNTKDAELSGGGRILQGVEFDVLGRRVAYWLFREHPGSSRLVGAGSYRIPASEILHIFRASRPGQVRAASWFAPVLLRFKDFDEMEDATLMKQKIAACLAVITTDVDGSATAIGTADTTTTPELDLIEPGAIMNVPPGRSIEVVRPPQTNDYDKYAQTVLRAIATGLGVSYEDLTGDYTELPFSAARMSRLRHWARVDDWRWRMLIPQFCDPVWAWAMQTAAILGAIDGIEYPQARWSAPPAPMVDPDKEGLAYQRRIRSGLLTQSEAIRELGYDPDELLNEMASDNKKLDELGLVLDSDPRKMTQAGQQQGATAISEVAS